MKTYGIHFEADHASMYPVFDDTGFNYWEALHIVKEYNEGCKKENKREYDHD